jgi:predicted branched-subunit amino acid permease
MVGAFAGDLIGDTDRFGLDAVYPTFFLALLVAELRNPRSRPVALAGAAIALALVPFTPPGIPILAAGVAALVGWRR